MPFDAPQIRPIGDDDFQIVATGSDLGADDELEIDLEARGIRKLRILRFRVELLDGSAAAISPELRTVDGSEIVTDGTATREDLAYPGGGLTVYAHDGRLIVAPAPDAGADNSIRVELHLHAGPWVTPDAAGL